MPTSNRALGLTSLAVLVAGALLGSARRVAAQAEPKPSSSSATAKLMTPQDIDALPHRAPDRRISYGKDPQQYGELRIPLGPGPHPLAILVHGGCFKAEF